MSVAVGPAPVLEDVGASEESLRAALAAVLEENRELRRVAAVLYADNAELREDNAELKEDNAELRDRDARREQELERLRVDLAVLQRLLVGRSSERSRPESGGADAGEDAGDAADERAGSDRDSGEQGGDGKPKRGPGARAGRGVAGPDRGSDHRPVEGVLAPACRRDQVAGVRPQGRAPARPGTGCGSSSARTPSAS